MKPVECRRSPLAQGEVCRVERCHCGTLHVSIGALTLRLEPGAVADVAKTFERALASLSRASDREEGAIPPPHDPAERDLAFAAGAWEVRLFADDRFRYFAPRGLLHVQLWHPGARVSVLTPSRLTCDAYEVFPVRGWKERALTHANVARLVEQEHAIAFVEETTLREIERAFVTAPAAFEAAPSGAS